MAEGAWSSAGIRAVAGRILVRASRLARRAGLRPFRLVARPAVALLARRAGLEPVPLRTVLRVRRLAAGLDPLAPDPVPVPASTLRDEALARLLDGQELGSWTLGPAGIELLGRLCRERRPELVIEFGSGASTVCLAHLLRGTPEGRPARLVSVEQDAAFAEATRTRLRDAGLDDIAQVVHAPLARRDVDGVERSCYVLPDDFGERIGDGRAGLVLVDGPAAEPGARVGTLPLVRRWLAPGAVIVLDDALRDGELDTAARWAASGWISVGGVILADKGLLLADVLTP